MLIRCQKCQALFSLQDGVAASGASFHVECGRCLLVFPATAPRREITTPVQTPPAPLRAPPLPAAALELTRALRPRRPESQAGVEEGERDLRRVALRRRRLLVGAGVVAVVAIAAFAAAQLRRSGLAREAAARMEKARQKLLRDDLRSLEEAGALFTEAARMAPGEAGPEAERAFALLLQAATHKDLADRLGAAGLASERDPHIRDGTRLLQEGLAAAKVALEDDPEDPAALRAMALWSALADAPDRGARYLDQAEKKAAQDPYIPWTRAALSLAGPATREKQDRALSALATALQAEPRLLRAQVDAAAVSMDRQEPGPARDGFKKALEQNPQHERAKRLQALLPAAP
ncbi:MAG TPA: hypothetical protein VF993_06160 [Myxococcales bacterium]